MTTTNVYQGRELDRNTSRVLAPPGGASNDIFGTGASNNQANMEQYERAKPSHSIYENNDIFGSGDRNAMQVPDAHHGRRTGLKPKDESSLNVMGGSQIGGDNKTRGDAKTITSDEATAAVQGQRFKAKGQASAYNPVSWSLNPGQSDGATEPLRSPRGHGLGPKASTFNVLTGEDYAGAAPQEVRAGKKHSNQARDTRPW